VITMELRRSMAAAGLVGVLFLSVYPVCLGQSQVRTELFAETTGPTQRSWLEFRASTLTPGSRPPLIVVLHPGASSPANIESTSRWSMIAEEHGLMVVYPGSTPGATPTTGVWNSWDWVGAPIPEGTPINLSQRDDLGFLSQLIERVCARTVDGADASRVFMTGFSSGAQMTSTYAGAGLSNVAAFGPVSGGWCEPYGVPEQFCVPAGPTRLWYWRGARENNLSPSGVGRLVHDQMQRDFWVAWNGASETPGEVETRSVTDVRVVQGQSQTVTVTQTTEYYGDGLAEVRYTEVEEGGHEYQVSAARRLWTEFFGAIPTCDGVDFNNDGSSFDPTDIEAFLSVFSEGPCVPTTRACNDIDFNNDGGLFDPCDIDSFLVLFSEGPCTACGV